MEVLMKFSFSFVFLLLCFFIGNPYAAALNYPVQIGNKTVHIKVWPAKSDKVVVHLHENEITALKAAQKITRKHPATVISLAHGGGRDIVFYLNHQRFECDPNRIFSDRGIKNTLVQHGHYSKAAHRAVKRLAVEILKHIPNGRIIAVHNNQYYSMKDYFPRHPLASEALAIAYAKKEAYRNFYLVTQVSDFKRLKALGENVVLQSEKAQDDGSLSTYFHQSSYVNVEAGLGQYSAQLHMLSRL